MIQQQQLPLLLNLQEHATFANYQAASNVIVVDALKNSVLNKVERFIYIYGKIGCGRSHLLQACCHLAAESNLSCAYLPLQQSTIQSKILQNLEKLDLICIDDIDLIAKQPEWEEAIFHLYNRIQQNDTRLIISGSSIISQLNLQLADLSSRLAASISYNIQDMLDDDKLIALSIHAYNRGIELPNDVGLFLIRRWDRNMIALMHALELLDKASLTAQRKLTIPFVKTILNI